MSELKIRVYRTNLGLFISRVIDAGYWLNYRLPDTYLYNGSLPKDTNHKDWILVDGDVLSSVKEKVMGSRVNYKYQIKDPNDISEKCPEFLTRDQVGYEVDDDYDSYWNNQDFKKYRTWYKEIYDTTKDSWEDAEFEVKDLGEIEISSLSSPLNITYKVQRTNYPHEGTADLDLSQIARYYDLDKMLVPEFAIQERPCNLSSTQTYNIIREYIKDNIDPKNATVTSDYNFCFTVKKKIKVKPWIKSYEIKKKNGRSYAKPRITKTPVEYKTGQIFEMTHTKDNHKGYTPVVGFKGETLQELADNIKLFLDELMYYINTEVTECEHCCGTGNIIKSGFDINKRV